MAVLGGSVLGADTIEDDVIDRVSYDQVPFRDIVKDIQARSRLKVAIQAGDVTRLNRPVTLHLSAISAEEVLRYAAVAAGLGFESDDRGQVTISANANLTTEFFRIEIVDREITSAKLQEFFQAGGISFPPGSKMEYSRRTDTLTSVNTSYNQHRIAMIVGRRTPRGAPRLRLNPELAFVNNLEIARKLDAISIGPEGKATLTLRKILIMAHDRSVANDPEHSGINFVLVPEVKADEVVLSLGLSKMTMREFLRTIGAAAGLSWRYDDFAVILYPTPPSVVADNAASTTVKAPAKAVTKGLKLKGEKVFEP